MGHKVHPLGFRLGVIRNWQAKWYAEKSYVEFLHEDLELRQAIESGYAEAGVSLVEIERQANKVSITIHTARPGVVIGRGGQRVDEMRALLESLIGKRIQLSILEIQQPELDAYLVARAVAEQIEHRVAFRRAMKQAMFRTMQSGAKGMRISCAGRLGGTEIARREVMHQGQVPLHTLRADIDYGLTEARTTLGRIGVKVWIYRGDILPEPSRLEAEEAPAEPAAVGGVKTKPPVTSEAEEKPAEPVAPLAEEKAPKAKVKEKAPEAKEKAIKAEKKAPKAKVKEKAPEAKEKAPKAKVKEEAPEAKEKAPKAKVKEEAPEAKPKEKAIKPKKKAPEAKEKTPKRRTRKTTKAKPPVTEGKEETDATAQAGEVPQES
ncbi:MAG: 30S ribosomal protein S3 [Dehalococcoidales bacterium]|nr:30S ribosomal protein S3 [Dehalococcoidales bacterium]